MTNHDRIKRAFDALSPKKAFIPRPAPSPRPRLAAALCAGALRKCRYIWRMDG